MLFNFVLLEVKCHLTVYPFSLVGLHFLDKQISIYICIYICIYIYVYIYICISEYLNTHIYVCDM